MTINEEKKSNTPLSGEENNSPIQEKDFPEQVRKEAARQLRIILKGAAELVGKEELWMKLLRAIHAGTSLNVKLGLDPSAPDIHLGHAVVLRKLKQMQDMGHHIIIIIGDFTGRIGDPTGKSKGRKALTDRQVLLNAMTYQEQIFRILDQEKTEVRFNGEWLELLNLEEILGMAASTTVARMMEREDFRVRFQNNVPIGIHEFLYPLMQGFDSIAIEADIELGGTDQTFNILMGRAMQKNAGMEPQAALFMPILEGLDGVEKMSKSLGNYIGVQEEARVMFKKVMEVPDRLIERYFELTTDETPERVEEIRQLLKEGANPRDSKLQLARIITGLYHSREELRAAEKFYGEAFAAKSVPEDVPELMVQTPSEELQQLFPALIAAGIVSAGNELRRLLIQGGIQVNGEKVTDMTCPVKDGDILRIGKRRFLKILRTS